jgi:hypothetical protein
MVCAGGKLSLIGWGWCVQQLGAEGGQQQQQLGEKQNGFAVPLLPGESGEASSSAAGHGSEGGHAWVSSAGPRTSLEPNSWNEISSRGHGMSVLQSF